MIGFFDSGFGGLTILKEVAKTLPDYSYIYLGDNGRSPYGSRSEDIIYQYTLEGVESLFRHGAQIVILACNTSSAVTLKKLQQQWLPQHYPEKKILGIIIPVAEEVKSFKSDHLGILATIATVNSGVFLVEIAKIDPKIKVIQQACPLLVPMIEFGEFDQLEIVVEKYLRDLFVKDSEIDTLVLGCTHYAIIEDVFRKFMPENVRIISQGNIVAEKLKDYLVRHIELENRLKKKGKRIFLTTESSPRIKNLAQMFYGDNIDLEVVTV